MHGGRHNCRTRSPLSAGHNGDMSGTGRFILIVCLLQGAMGRHWAIWMPQSIEALSGSCVLIPCRFDIPYSHINKLTSNATAMLVKVKVTGKRILLESSAAGNQMVQPATKQNPFEGYLIGNLLKKNCTSILNNIASGDSNKYFFRVDSEILKFTYKDGVQINVTDTPPKPKLTPDVVEVLEGTSVNLSCSAFAPCPNLPPNLSWTPRLGDSVDQLQENEDGTKSASSVLTFTASHLHHGQKITCRALYTRLQGDTQNTTEASLILGVQYVPQISGSGSCSRSAEEISCSCESRGNPSPSLEWHVSGLRVTNSTDRVIREEQLGNTGLRSFLTVLQSQGDTPTVLCVSVNALGNSSLQLPSPRQRSGSQCSLVQHVVCGTLAFLYILTVCVGVYKYKSLCKQMKAQSEEKVGDTYERLQISTITSSDYDVIRKDLHSRRGTEDGTSVYENVKGINRKGSARNVR